MSRSKRMTRPSRISPSIRPRYGLPTDSDRAICRSNEISKGHFCARSARSGPHLFLQQRGKLMGITAKYRLRAIGRSTLFLGICLVVPLVCPRAAVAQNGTIKGRLIWGGDAIPSKVLEEKGKAEK